jgi:hypothetical protein
MYVVFSPLVKPVATEEEAGTCVMERYMHELLFRILVEESN